MYLKSYFKKKLIQHFQTLLRGEVTLFPLPDQFPELVFFLFFSFFYVMNLVEVSLNARI